MQKSSQKGEEFFLFAHQAGLIWEQVIIYGFADWLSVKHPLKSFSNYCFILRIFHPINFKLGNFSELSEVQQTSFDMNSLLDFFTPI